MSMKSYKLREKEEYTPQPCRECQATLGNISWMSAETYGGTFYTPMGVCSNRECKLYGDRQQANELVN